MNPSANICAKCGRLFNTKKSKLCPTCVEEEWEFIDKIKLFLSNKKNFGATFNDLHKETGITREQLHDYVKKGYISLPTNMNITYPCYKCDKPIKRGMLCTECTQELKKDIKSAYGTDTNG